MRISQPVFKVTREWKRELVECPQWEPFYLSMESAIYFPCPFPIKCIGEDWVMRQKIYVRTDIYPLAWIWYFWLFRVEKSWVLFNKFLILLLEIWGLAIAQPSEEISWTWVARKIKEGRSQ